MVDLPVVDTSPIIYLSRAGRVDLLQLVGPELAVPQEVADEVMVAGESDPAVRVLRTTPWLKVVPPIFAPHQVLAWDLGRGETAVISHGIQHQMWT